MIQFYKDRHDAEHADYWMEKKREWDRKALEEIRKKKDGFGSVWEQEFVYRRDSSLHFPSYDHFTPFRQLTSIIASFTNSSMLRSLPSWH